MGRRKSLGEEGGGRREDVLQEKEEQEEGRERGWRGRQGRGERWGGCLGDPLSGDTSSSQVRAGKGEGQGKGPRFPPPRVWLFLLPVKGAVGRAGAGPAGRPGVTQPGELHRLYITLLSPRKHSLTPGRYPPKCCGLPWGPRLPEMHRPLARPGPLNQTSSPQRPPLRRGEQESHRALQNRLGSKTRRPGEVGGGWREGAQV